MPTSETGEPLRQRETYSSLLMTTPSALLAGSNPYCNDSILEGILEACLDLQLSPESIDVRGTYSVILESRLYTIDFFWMGNHICLGISLPVELGPQEPVKKGVIMKAKSIFWRLATWLYGLMRFGK